MLHGGKCLVQPLVYVLAKARPMCVSCIGNALDLQTYTYCLCLTARAVKCMFDMLPHGSANQGKDIVCDAP